MNREKLFYYVFLARRYIGKNLSRSVYSVLGIMLTVILGFGTLTVGYALFDYDLQEVYERYDGCQLHAGSYLEAPLMFVSRLKNHEMVDHVFVDRQVIEQENGVEIEVEYDVYVALKDTSNLRESAEQLGKDLGTEEIRPDEYIEEQLGQGDSLALAGQRVIVSLVATLFVAFSMFIIRNSMMLSILERRNDYGQFRCVGMSRKQLWLLLLAEGLCYSVVGCAIGIVVGFGVLKAMEGWLVEFLMLEDTFHFSLYLSNVLLTLVLSVSVTLFALLEPARQAWKATPVEAMRKNTEGVPYERRKYKVKKHPLLGFLFGVEGEYARKNITRCPVRMLYLFVGILVCVSLVCGVTCFVDCIYATMQMEYQGTNLEFPEVVMTNGSYQEDTLKEMETKVSAMKGVENTGLWLEKTDLSVNIYDPHLLSQEIFDVQQKAYSPEEIEVLADYVVEGEVSYDKMMKEKGVILCDYVYRVSDEESGFNYEDRRITDYKVGDTITELTSEAYYDCIQTANRLLKDTGLEAYNEEMISMEPDEEDINRAESEAEKEELQKTKEEMERQHRQYTKKFIKALQNEGYSVKQTASGEKITDESYWMDIFQAALFDKYQKGETETLTVQAIIKEDVLNSGSEFFTAAMFDEGVSSAFRVIRPRDAVLSDAYNDLSSYGTRIFADTHQWSWGLGVMRDVYTMSDDLEQYAHGYYSEYYDDWDIKEGDMVLLTLSSLIDIADSQLAIHMAQTIGYCIAAFIGYICLIQIFNTVCANLSLRSSELELYRIVGMSRGQEYKMIILEHGLVAIFAIILSYFFAWGLSYWAVEIILNQDGQIAYHWSTFKMMALCLVIFSLTVLASLAGIRQGKKRE